MAKPQLDRFQVNHRPLAERENRTQIETKHIDPSHEPRELPQLVQETLGEAAERIKAARAIDRPVILAYGAHTIKNCLGPVLRWLVDSGWITHLATNGAGIIHDWEFAFQGQSSEDVGKYVRRGQFGNWQETGFYINLALNVGAYEGRGYGESVGAMIDREGLTIPSAQQLAEEIRDWAESAPEQAAAAADLLSIVQKFELPAGEMKIAYPHKKYSVQAGAYAAGAACTGHPMIGHDIIYNHPMNHCAALGRCAQRDFLTYAEGVSRLEGGVYLSVGSAVMSPMIFEKSLSMGQNLALQRGESIDNFYILVGDLAACDWDWRKGEPPEDNPAYYMRYNKSFSRMGGDMRYVQADNRDLLLTLVKNLSG